MYQPYCEEVNQYNDNSLNKLLLIATICCHRSSRGSRDTVCLAAQRPGAENLLQIARTASHFGNSDFPDELRRTDRVRGKRHIVIEKPLNSLPHALQLTKLRECELTGFMTQEVWQQVIGNLRVFAQIELAQRPSKNLQNLALVAQTV